MKKLISAVILAAMLLTAAACSSKIDGNETVTASNDTSAANETIVAEEKLELPADADFDGHEFHIYGYSHSAYIIEHLAEEMNGDLVNDAIYQRNSAVGELLNVIIVADIFAWDNELCRTNIRNSVMAGDEAFDLFTGGAYNMSALSAEGMFKKLSSVGYIDVNKPWWNQSSYEALSVGQKAYMLMGDISISNYGQLTCYFFNKKHISDYNMEDPYEIFNADKWTCDKLISLTKDFYVDVNGNDTRDETDIYGEYSPLQSVYDISNNWVTITEKDSENYPQVVFYSERTQQMFDKLREYFVNSVGVYAPMGWTDIGLFIDGNSVFVYGSINHAVRLRDMESDYGILPIPKYDESQQEYTTGGHGLLIAIPKTASDTDRTGMITEALSHYGKKLAYPAYVETTITIKGTRDEEAEQALEIILGSTIYDFGCVYSGFQGYGYSLLEYINGSDGFSSFFEKYSVKATKELNDYADKILALDD